MNIINEARKLRSLIENMAQTALDDETAEENANVFPKWENGIHYTVDYKVRYNDVLYKCIQEHTSQEDWTPDVAVSLFVKVHKQDPQDEWPEWVQPTGAHDAYQLGDKVSHNEKHWISNINDNVWEPSVYGWDEEEEQNETERQNI